jgi:hypothetical protein
MISAAGKMTVNSVTMTSAEGGVGAWTFTT